MSPIYSFTATRACRYVTLAASAMLVSALTGPFAAKADERFQSPQEAIAALVSAAKAGDRKSLLTILGRRGNDIVSSGDQVADAEARERFINAYDTKHGVNAESEGKVVLVVGADDFPFPIPLVRKGRGAWAFDTEAGRREILRLP